MRAHLRGLTLRTRLTAVVVLVAAAVLLVISVATALGLRTYLVGQLDKELEVALDRATRAPVVPGFPGRPVDHPSLAFLVGRGTPDGSLGARVGPGGAVVAAITYDQGTLSLLDQPSKKKLAGIPADGDAHDVTVSTAAGGSDTGSGGTPTVSAAGAGVVVAGDYRVLARRQPDGSGVLVGRSRSGADDAVRQLVVVMATASGAGLLLAGLGGAAIVRHTLRPLNRIAATAARVSTLTLDHGEVALAERVPVTDTDDTTEVGRVGASLNRMLDHVAGALTVRHESEMQVRRFVADASHELRTPLAAIRGYAELTGRRRAELPVEAARAIDHIESASVRMSGLVDDLLLLARLDAGRALSDSTVELTALVIQAVSDAHAAGPDHEWRFSVPDEPVQVVGDELRLHQVVGNLLTNARVHTPAGSMVEVTLSRAGESALLRVSDNGPGIPADLRGRVFERFVRGDASRSRTTGSTGLGLAIVDAVVTAHHGEVTLRSEPGQTSFDVSLPLAHPTDALSRADRGPRPAGR